MSMTFYISLLFSPFGLTPAMAQQSQTIINIRNAGGINCGQFLGAMRQENNPIDKTAFLQWAAAYTTAFSRERSLIDAFPIIDTRELVVMTGLLCLEDERVTFEVALRTALSRLEPFWVKGSPEILNLTDPSGRRVEFFAEATTAFQEALNLFGAEITVDGAYGNQTGNAVRRLNEARGSTPWLTPDGELLYQLTRPQTN
ncbi:peptidoglycan-binding protein [Falsigemmobacter intermedius]